MGGAEHHGSRTLIIETEECIKPTLAQLPGIELPAMAVLTRNLVKSNAYFDSVALMRIAATFNGRPEGRGCVADDGDPGQPGAARRGGFAGGRR